MHAGETMHCKPCYNKGLMQKERTGNCIVSALSMKIKLTHCDLVMPN